MQEAYLFEALRTPRGKGKATGALFELKPVDLVVGLLEILQGRTGMSPAAVNDLLLGCVTPVADQGNNIARAALLEAGWEGCGGGMQLNRYCASGLEAINLAAMKVRSGWNDLIVAGGLESMSRVPMGSDGGPLLYDPEVISDSIYLPQGVAADLIATLEGFSRESLDDWAVLSQQRAARAQQEGHFARSLVPIYDRNGLPILLKDEYMRPDTTKEVLAQLPSAFADLGDSGFDAMALHAFPELSHIRHPHTAGNSSGMVDGAALVVVGTKAAGEAAGMKPRARVLAAATVSVDPTTMLTGPVPAAQRALELAGLDVEDVDLWECNEAFSSVVLYTLRHLGLDPEKVNVSGGAIALGHPLGATGAMLTGQLLDDLERLDKSIGAVTMCVGGGMGVAMVMERV